MSNRVLAKDIVRAVADEAARVIRGERPDWSVADAKTEQALDAAERHGKIEALEWALPIFGQSRHAKRLRDELARLRAEEVK